MLEENRRRVEESQRREALEQQQKEEERYRELERIQKLKEEAARRKKLEEEERKLNQMMLLGKNKSRPKLSFGIGSKWMLVWHLLQLIAVGLLNLRPCIQPLLTCGFFTLRFWLNAGLFVGMYVIQGLWNCSSTLFKLT